LYILNAISIFSLTQVEVYSLRIRPYTFILRPYFDILHDPVLRSYFSVYGRLQPCVFDLCSLDGTSPDMGPKAMTKIRRKRGEKCIQLIGDMGFAMEELLFDVRRLFHHPQPGVYHYIVCIWTLHSQTRYRHILFS
jgi:hypothetical protein